MEKIESLGQLQSFYSTVVAENDCILVIYDNKSQIPLQTIVVHHPLDYIRNLNEVSKNLRLPVLDIDIKCIGYIDKDFNLFKLEDTYLISPYVYFNKPEDVSIDVGSNSSTPPVED